MDPVTWGAIAAILPMLGDALPGMLVAGIAMYVYRQREREFDAKEKEWADCEKQYIDDYKELLAKVFSVIDTANAAMSALATNLAVQNRTDRVGAQLDGLAQKIQSQEVKVNGNAKGRSGQTGGKAG
jgi:hypothetical protein